MGRILRTSELVYVIGRLRPLIHDRVAVVLVTRREVVAIAVTKLRQSLDLSSHTGNRNEFIVGSMQDRVRHVKRVLEDLASVLILRTALVRFDVARGVSVEFEIFAVKERCREFGHTGPRPLCNRPRNRRCGGKSVWVQQREQVGGPAPHRVARYVDVIALDGERVEHVLPHLEDVHMTAAHVPSGAAPAGGSDDDRALVLAELFHDLRHDRGTTVGATAAPVEPPLQRNRLRRTRFVVVSAWDENAVMLVDPLLSRFVRNPRRRIGKEDPVVVARAGDVLLGSACRQLAGVELGEESIDSSLEEVESLRAVEPDTHRLVETERDVSDVCLIGVVFEVDHEMLEPRVIVRRNSGRHRQRDIPASAGH
jgi:hypothetical protein